MAQSVNLPLKEVERIEITTLIDNYVDLMLQDTPIVKRPPLSTGKELPKDTLVAEHGLSLMITTYRGSESHSILFDAGYNKNGVMHNIDQLGIDKVYGVLGGLHLSGAFFETVIERTVDALKEINPEVIVRMHCTGWNAVKRLADTFPGAFTLNSVRSKFILI